eukprot:COSAG01_NODE_158_length_23708_cov_7.921979_18_plen_85_part_00
MMTVCYSREQQRTAENSRISLANPVEHPCCWSSLATSTTSMYSLWYYKQWTLCSQQKKDTRPSRGPIYGLRSAERGLSTTTPAH